MPAPRSASSVASRAEIEKASRRYWRSLRPWNQDRSSWSATPRREARANPAAYWNNWLPIPPTRRAVITMRSPGAGGDSPWRRLSCGRRASEIATHETEQGSEPPWRTLFERGQQGQVGLVERSPRGKPSRVDRRGDRGHDQFERQNVGMRKDEPEEPSQQHIHERHGAEGPEIELHRRDGRHKGHADADHAHLTGTISHRRAQSVMARDEEEIQRDVERGPHQSDAKRRSEFAVREVDLGGDGIQDTGHHRPEQDEREHPGDRVVGRTVEEPHDRIHEEPHRKAYGQKHKAKVLDAERGQTIRTGFLDRRQH